MIKFLVVVTGWNWSNYIIPCINSLSAQTYRNFIISIVDDGSTDNSPEIIKEHTSLSPAIKVTLLNKNVGTFFARDLAIKQVTENYDVIVLLDGDDLLYPNALEKVAEQYAKGKLMTYGSWINQDEQPCVLELNYPPKVHKKRSYRKDVFRCTHLRTFHRKLYEAIPEWSLIKSEIESYPDAEILFSMMEMAGEERIGVIETPIYNYNETNPDRTLKRFGKDVKGYHEICNRPKRKLYEI